MGMGRASKHKGGEKVRFHLYENVEDGGADIFLVILKKGGRGWSQQVFG